MTIVLLVGPPGAGKGTQAAKIVEKYGWNWLSTGEALRKHIKEGTELGKKVQTVVDAGNLVSDDLLLEILSAEIKPGKPTLLDGYPRNISQANTLDAREDFGNVSMVLHFDVERGVLESRISKRAKEEGRADDTLEKFSKRLDIYENDTLPVIKHYEGCGNYHRIEADGKLEEVFSRVENIIDDNFQA